MRADKASRLHFGSLLTHSNRIQTVGDVAVHQDICSLKIVRGQ